MRFMVIVKANKDSEAGVLPTREVLAEMGKYNEELVKAGVMLAGEGLHASSKGARVRFDGKKRTVIDGPFAETKEQLLGFYVVDCESLDAAIAFARSLPTVQSVFEIRPVQLFYPGNPLPAIEHRPD